MKNKNLSSIIKASLKSNKALSAMFCFFVIISFVLILLAVGIIVPLGINIEEKINNHILNREIVIEISEVVSEEEHKRRLQEIRSIPEVIDIYTNPFSIYVNDESKLIKGEYELNFVHKYYDLEIVSGRAFDESEEFVALIPAKFQDYDSESGYVSDVDGTTLVGKTLHLKDMTDTVREFKIVGTFDTTDPIFRGKEILIPRAQLSEYQDAIVEAFPDRYQKESSYIVVTDSPKSTEEVYAKVEKITNSYKPHLNIDAETYNIAFSIILFATIMFALLTTFGFYLFLKSNINARTNEFALYKAIGFRQRDLYRILWGEHLTLTLCSLILGVSLYYLIAHFAVNPYLLSLMGGTYMEMTLNSNPLFALMASAGFVLITLLVSHTAVRRTEKIDLTVLLRE